MNLNIEHLEKHYGAQSVLQDINLSLSNVHAVGIIGESGCGKSTLLRQIAGIEDPDEGVICIDGASPITDKRAFQENIGVVFQKHNLFPHLTIRENLLLILEKIKKQDKRTAEKTVDALLARFAIAQVAHKRPDEVSGGQAQRASIARALSTHPSLVFLDEPTAALDPILTQEVLSAVVDLKQDGCDFIFVTHEIAFLKEFADYVIFLKDGRVWEHGDSTCLAQPKTAELATFLQLDA